tara:strand:+ start:804 stop:1019 length:216 start_codon:yes stop_codon:yes gene_type:complete
MKYKNKDGIELNYSSNDVHQKLVKEVIEEAVDMLVDTVKPGPLPMRAHHRVQVQETIDFLRENFNLGDKDG